VTGPRRLWAAILLLTLLIVLPQDPGASRAVATASEGADVDADIAAAIERDRLPVPRLATDTGFTVADDAIWSYYSSRGGAITFGRPISRMFTFRGAEIQLFERAALKKLPDRSVAVFNLIDLLPYSPIDGYTLPAADPEWIATIPAATTPDYPAAVNEYIQTYVPDSAKGMPVGFRTRYLESVPPWTFRGDGTARFMAALELWGFPTSPPTEDPRWPIVYQRFERAYFMYESGTTRIVPLGRFFQHVLVGSPAIGDLAEQASGTALWQQYLPREAKWLRRPAELASTDLTAAFLPDALANSAGVASSSAAHGGPALRGPEYGMNVFVWDFPFLIDRDIGKISQVGFQWQKSLFQWKRIEPEKGVFDWENAERVVKASNAAGVKVIARVDFQPEWARSSPVFNGPPDRYEDFGEFVYALVDHFRPDSPFGTIHAIELWNEPNLRPFWGEQAISAGAAADYVRLLCIGHEAAKRASPGIITISAGLSPTGTRTRDAMDDTVYAQWMYDAGAKPCFDVLGVHGAGYKAPPWIGPAELAADTSWGGHSSFGFRRVEQVRDVMVRNGDAAKQIWLTEFGWTSDTLHPSYAWHRVTEEQKAQYVVEAYRWAHLNWQPWIGAMVLWNLPSPDWTEDREEWWWAVANPDGTDRPAFEALGKARGAGVIP
jgi:hypothetical protein